MQAIAVLKAGALPYAGDDCPIWGQSYNNLGILLARMQRHEEAIRSFERAIELEPGNTMFSDNLSSLLESLGRWREALSIQVGGEARDTQSEGAVNPEIPNPQAHVMAGQDMPALQYPTLWLLQEPLGASPGFRILTPIVRRVRGDAARVNGRFS